MAPQPVAVAVTQQGVIAVGGLELLEAAEAVDGSGTAGRAGSHVQQHVAWAQAHRVEALTTRQRVVARLTGEPVVVVVARQGVVEGRARCSLDAGHCVVAHAVAAGQAGGQVHRPGALGRPGQQVVPPAGALHRVVARPGHEEVVVVVTDQGVVELAAFHCFEAADDVVVDAGA